jgi:hypothetical protein
LASQTQKNKAEENHGVKALNMTPKCLEPSQEIGLFRRKTGYFEGGKGAPMFIAMCEKHCGIRAK